MAVVFDPLPMFHLHLASGDQGIKDLDILPIPAWYKVNLMEYCFKVPGKSVIPVGTK